jgi:hypothetical protein
VRQARVITTLWTLGKGVSGQAGAASAIRSRELRRPFQSLISMRPERWHRPLAGSRRKPPKSCVRRAEGDAIYLRGAAHHHSPRCDEAEGSGRASIHCPRNANCRA